ncbi:hypothetical protein CFC21_063634 [Triticum aestivum]|uniref:Acidic protein n=3 Tax=Triticinae TaxID=1648030 RepID=A0A453JC23_AEGTS|nr:hypothetical protein CFC21_063634 [Triticum aestivum]
MAAASALKTAAVVAICIAMLLVQTTLGVGYLTAQAPAGGGLACPDTQTTCGANCLVRCESMSQNICKVVCTASPFPVVDQTCAGRLFSACVSICKTACENLPSY